MQKRKNYKLGIHFDFHARPNMVVGDLYSPESIEKMLDAVKPDFVQCDTKGHAGLSSYPTKVGYQADEIKHDVLKLWRDLTKKRGIALYAHHSGFYDIKAISEHPEWAVVDENGNVSSEFVSIFSEFADELLIPQLKEMARDYELDGAWIDGECWGFKLDYSEKAKRAYLKETGKEIPKREDEDFENYRAFLRQSFEKYVEHYVSEVKKEYPDFEITSNWIFSDFMPKKACVNVDFLSGDYSASNSVDSARFSARCLDAQNMPWDLMAWGQNSIPVDWKTDDRQNKSATQLIQEAAVVVSLGGCFEFFDILYGHGCYVQEWMIDDWAKVGEFVRKRTEWCFGTLPLHEVGVILPEMPIDKQSDFLYTNCCDVAKGWVFALQDCSFSTEIVLSDDFERLKDFSTVVLPRADIIEPQMLESVIQFVRCGGNLVCDLESAKYFKDYLNFDFTNKQMRQLFIDGNGKLASVKANSVLLPKDNDKHTMFLDNHYLTKGYAPFKIVDFGKGKFIFNLFDFGCNYLKNKSTPIRNYINLLFESFGVTPIAKTNYSPYIDVTLRKNGDEVVVNLLNMLGAHNENAVREFHFIPPLHDVEIEIKCENKPKSVKLVPENIECDFTYQDKIIKIKLEKLEIHSAIVIKEK